MKKLLMTLLTIVGTTAFCEQSCKAFVDNTTESTEVVSTYIAVPEDLVNKASFDSNNTFEKDELVIVARNIVEIDQLPGFIYATYVGPYNSTTSELLILDEVYQPRKWSIDNNQIGKLANN